jgi:hypothetical protein
MTDPRMSESNKPVDPRVEVVARAICNIDEEPSSEWPKYAFISAGIIRALDEYERTKQNG